LLFTEVLLSIKKQLFCLSRINFIGLVCPQSSLIFDMNPDLRYLLLEVKLSKSFFLLTFFLIGLMTTKNFVEHLQSLFSHWPEVKNKVGLAWLMTNIWSNKINFLVVYKKSPAKASELNL